MVIIETPIFTKRIDELLPLEEYLDLQIELIKYPDDGEIISGSGGIRKLRWAAKGKGKRGGVRILYYWAVEQEQLFLLYVYAKNEQHNITSAQLKIIRILVEKEFKHGRKNV